MRFLYRRLSVAVLVCGLAFLAVPRAHAYFYVVAVDTSNGEMGIARAWCKDQLDPTFMQPIADGLVPGAGVVGVGKFGILSSATQPLSMGADPAQIIADLAAMNGSDARQFGIVDLAGRSAAFTGDYDGTGGGQPLLSGFAEQGHRLGSVEAFHYAVLGNHLTSLEVLDLTQAAFVGCVGCSLAERLLVALEGGAAQGGGDYRCVESTSELPDGFQAPPADKAFLQVTDENAQTIVRVEVSGNTPGSKKGTCPQIGMGWPVDPDDCVNPLVVLRTHMDRYLKPECSDTLDNNGDGTIDADDPGCTSSADYTEALDCSDGFDNDFDGRVDYHENAWIGDPGCYSAEMFTEEPQCDDYVDNDGDGLTDHPPDQECTARWDNTERCGIGFEIALVVPVLMTLRARARRRSGGNQE